MQTLREKRCGRGGIRSIVCPRTNTYTQNADNDNEYIFPYLQRQSSGISEHIMQVAVQL